MNTRVLFSHRARRVFFFIHLWTGLLLGLWFALIGITGSVLSWRFELQGIEMAQRYPIQKPAAGAQMISLSQAVAAMKAAHPDATPRELSTITVPNSRMTFYTFSRGKSRAEMKTYAVDPYSAQVHPPVQMRTFFGGQVQQFHQRLFLGAKGFVANGFLNLLAIPLVLSGLWLWWPTKLKHLKAHLTIKRGVSLKRTLYDLHNVLGIYLYVVLLVTTVTGAMLAFQRIGNAGGIAAFINEEQSGPAQSGAEKGSPPRGARDSARAERPAGPPEREKKEITVTPEGERKDFDQLIALARDIHPRFELRRVKTPARPNQPMELSFARPYGMNQDETVLLNPYTGRQIEVAPEDGEQRRSPARQWAHDLHLGEFGGVLSKVIYTITGLLPLGLFVTGFLLWWRKKRAKMQRARQATA